VIQWLGSANQKFSGTSTWELGKRVLPDGSGDPLNVWANRQLPYGVEANRFDGEGIPSQRLPLIQENVLQSFSASQRYAEYLQIPATGEFGVIEVGPGLHATADLLAEPHVEVVAFSWFNPDPITGDFACEIRLGYVVDGGKRTPFKGGQLIGNYLAALAGARWSREEGFYGGYQGPSTVRFEQLTVAA
jgi:predicted Zn-dependent protease